MKTNLKSIQPLLFVVFIVILASGCSKTEETKDPFYTPPPQADPFITAFVNDLNADSISAWTTQLQNMQPRFMLSENRRTIAVFIRDKFIQLGYPGTQLDSFYLTSYYNDTTYHTWQYNIVASLNGITSADTVYIVGAHYDAILNAGNPWNNAPGADDDAGGVASLFELARVMKKRNFQPKSTIQFVAFGAEELNMDGSNNFTQKAVMTGKKIKWMLNHDMISYEPSAVQADWKLNIMDYANSTTLRMDAQRMAGLYTCMGTVNDNTHNQEGDSYNFFLRGYQALFFISYSSTPHYHTLQDLTSNCNFNYCREVTKISCAMLVEQNK
jgi:leucyl aminopeptidase